MDVYIQNVETLRELMARGFVVTLTFTKKDGSKRTVEKATTSPYMIPTAKHAKGSDKTTPDHQVRFYSIDDGGWRSIDSNNEFKLSINWDYNGYVIYTKDNCRYCTAAKDFLKANKASYHELKIGEDVSREFIQENWPDHKTAPVILTQDGTLIGGYKELKLLLTPTGDA